MLTLGFLMVMVEELIFNPLQSHTNADPHAHPEGRVQGEFASRS
jgi:hypothetical protein